MVTCCEFEECLGVFEDHWYCCASLDGRRSGFGGEEREREREREIRGLRFAYLKLID